MLYGACMRNKTGVKTSRTTSETEAAKRTESAGLRELRHELRKCARS